MCGFHLASNLVIALLRGLAYEVAVQHELIPVDVSAFVDHFGLFPFAIGLCAMLVPPATLCFAFSDTGAGLPTKTRIRSVFDEIWRGTILESGIWCDFRRDTKLSRVLQEDEP